MESIKDIILRMLMEQRDAIKEESEYSGEEIIEKIEDLINIILNREEPSSNQTQRRLRQQVGQLKSENAALNEKLQNYIPRRRVRRVYKQIKKILEQDGITDDLDIEE